ncbi:hypothetical protein [Sphingobacterium cellulitidis]|uniref:hypothetical protein n=1 Tax=Sphingobacterium cellulitidis TaxID=1768011 RepID=UPI000B93D471
MIVVLVNLFQYKAFGKGILACILALFDRNFALIQTFSGPSPDLLRTFFGPSSDFFLTFFEKIRTRSGENQKKVR